jgi:hypothetical protein
MDDKALLQTIANELTAFRAETDGRLSRIERHLGLLGSAREARHEVALERAARARSQRRGEAVARRILQRQHRS